MRALGGHARRERSVGALRQTLRDREYLIRMNRLRQMLVRSKADRTLATFLGTFGRDHADRQPRKVFSPRIQLMSFSPSMTGMKPPHP